MQARQAREVREGSPDGETKGEQFTAADGTRIDRWTPSMRGETAQPNARVFNNAQTDDGMVEGGSTATQPVGMQDNVLLTRQVAHRTPNHGKEFWIITLTGGSCSLTDKQPTTPVRPRYGEIRTGRSRLAGVPCLALQT